MLITIFLFITVANTLILMGIYGYPTRQRRIPLPRNETAIQRRKVIFFFSSFPLPQYVYNVFPFSQKLVEKFQLEGKLKSRLDAAHINLTPGQFFSMKLFFMTIGALIGFFFLRTPQAWIILVATSLGFSLPDIWLTKKINERRNEIARVLPETVDLLGLCVEAGLDFTTSVKWIIEKKVTSNPMITELSLVLEEIRWGKQRSQALKDMARRLDIPEVNSFVQALVQSERMGTPVSETFGIISEDTRIQRFRRGERYALQAPIKILFPLIFFILPVIGIIVGGPILLQFTQGGLFEGFGGQ